MSIKIYIKLGLQYIFKDMPEVRANVHEDDNNKTKN